MCIYHYSKQIQSKNLQTFYFDTINKEFCKETNDKEEKKLSRTLAFYLWKFCFSRTLAFVRSCHEIIHPCFIKD